MSELIPLIPQTPGVYVLMLEASEDTEISIGRLGTFVLQRGFYLYVGSAFGPGGLRARIAHHRRSSSKPHWHVDYLRQHAQLVEIWFSEDRREREHQWASVLEELPDIRVPIPRFGSSDCTCPAHLFFSARMPEFSDYQSQILREIPKNAALYRSVGA